MITEGESYVHPAYGTVIVEKIEGNKVWFSTRGMDTTIKPLDVFTAGVQL